MVGLLVLLGLALLSVPVLLVWALVSLAGVKQRLEQVEGELARMRTQGGVAPAATAAPQAPGPEPTLAELVRRQQTPAPRPVPQPQPAAPAAEPAAAPAPAPVAPPPLPAAPVPARAPRPQVPRPAPARTGPQAEPAVLRLLKRWFSSGNVPVKIGVLVLLAGVAALLKYASDQGLFQLPIQLRLAGVAAAALAALAFAWRRRGHNRIFALSLQGGAIGVLLLVVFAATRLYGLLEPVHAFVVSVVLVAGMVLLAVLQNAQVLAALALLAGYMAPIWLSTGSGNHVALFSYYALLNAAVVVVAWFRAWRTLNLLGFVFTFGIGTLWGIDAYVPEKYATTQPFLALFFAFYLAVPLLFARQRPEGPRDLVDGCLVFGTPLVAFCLQAGLLEGQRLPLAFCALGLAALYAVLAWLLRRRGGYGLLGQAYAALAVGFATLAVPLGLSARATAAVFALEGAGLYWLGLRQQRLLPQLAGAGLQLGAALALALGLEGAVDEARALVNPTALGMLLIALGGWASAWAARAHGLRWPAAAFYLWGLAWWAGNGVREVDAFAPTGLRADLWLLLAGASGWLAAEVHRRRPAALLAATLLGAVLLAMPLLLLQGQDHVHPLGGRLGALAWLGFAVLVVRGLACTRGDAGLVAGAAQFASWLLWPLLATVEAGWLADHFGLGQGWAAALRMTPWLLLAALGLWRWSWLAWPRTSTAAAPLRLPLLLLVLAVLGAAGLLMLRLPLQPQPLAWLPLLNPGELAQLGALALAAAWLGSEQAPDALRAWRNAVLAGGGFLLLSACTLRSVHYWGGVAWAPGLLSSSLAQTSLTVVWSVLGVLGWIVGSRSGRRGLWLAGALLMGVVLAKLVLVDRTHLGNLTGIVSFIAYGVLCTIVGYLAPAPPRGATGNEESTA